MRLRTGIWSTRRSRASQPIRQEMSRFIGRRESCCRYAANATTLTQWFARLVEGGRTVDALQQRSWGGWDEQVVDRYGLHWLIGFED
jgi:uncharacterized glyoxalase superfamily protein PhnB